MKVGNIKDSNVSGVNCNNNIGNSNNNVHNINEHNNETNSNSFFRKIFLVLSIFNLIIGVINVYCIVNIFPRYNLDIDYIGIIIGFLSFLITVLAILFAYNIIKKSICYWKYNNR